MDFEQAPDDFGYVVFDRTDRVSLSRRFYMIAWQSTLLDGGAVVRTFRRKGRWKRVIATPFPPRWAMPPRKLERVAPARVGQPHVVYQRTLAPRDACGGQHAIPPR
jgi:hypothetical protein